MITTYEEYLHTERSLTLEKMQDIHSKMISDIGTDADAIEIYGELMDTVTKYAAIRTEWPLLNREEKTGRDSRRTSCHDSVIVKFNMLARYARMQGKDANWRDCLGYEEDNPYNRKRIGDFACYLAFVNGLNAR
ncbi:MAG: hypothetical protein HFH39_14085 [Lachnospiraceae bacterium]|nr:hypothetical protein [Lachnospiraceae bacterium]